MGEPAIADRGTDLRTVLEDLGALLPIEDLAHLRDALLAAKQGNQNGAVGLEAEISHGRATDAWVTSRLRAPRRPAGPPPRLPGIQLGQRPTSPRPPFPPTLRGQRK